MLAIEDNRDYYYIDMYILPAKNMDTIPLKDKDKITGLIKVLIPKARIYFFESRARGTHSPLSNVDIAVDAGEELPLVAIDEAKSIMTASNLIYHVDVVDFNNIPEKMRTAILQEGILWKH